MPGRTKAAPASPTQVHVNSTSDTMNRRQILTLLGTAGATPQILWAAETAAAGADAGFAGGADTLAGAEPTSIGAANSFTLPLALWGEEFALTTAKPG